MSYFNGKACFSPKVPSWIETVWSMNGGNVVSPRALSPRFGEAVGKVVDVDWLFGLDETDPWVKTWRANSNVVFHASYVLQVVSKRVNQTLVPMRNFIIGCPALRTRRFSPDDLSEPRRGEFTVRPSPPAKIKITDLSVSIDAPKISGRVSLLRSPTHGSRVEKSPYTRRSARTNTPPSIDLAKQSTLVDSLALHDNSKRPEQDSTSALFPQIPLAPAAAAMAPSRKDCPRIDLIALVREKQKAKKLRKKKPFTSPLQNEQRRHVVSQDSRYEEFSPLGPNPRGSRRSPRKLTDAHTRPSLTLKEKSLSVHPIPRIFEPISPFDYVSVFDDIERHWVTGQRKMNRFPFVL